MITFLAQKLKYLLIIVLVVIGISFVFFGDWTPHGATPGLSAKIKGRTISLTEYQNAVRAERLIFTLNTGQIPPTGGEADRLFAQRAWNRLLFLEQARHHGPSVPASRLDSMIRTSPLFVRPDNGQYAPEQFARFKQFVLDPQGISPERFLEILRDQIMLEQWVASVETAALVQNAELETIFRTFYGKVTMSCIEIPAASVVKEIPAGDDLLRAFYEKRPERYRLPEQRKLQVVFFKLPQSLEKADEAARAAARRELGEKAYQFTEPFFTALEAGTPLPDFLATARAQGLSVEVTPYLARQGAFPGVREGGQALLETAFLLTPERPVSDYVAIPEGFAVLHLLEVQPPQQRNFEEVKAQVREDYLRHETNQRLHARGENLILKLREALRSGQTWAQACATAGVRPISLPAFSPANEDDAPSGNLAAARSLASRMLPGTISDLFVREDKALIFYLAERAEPDPAQRDKALPALREQLLQERRHQARESWRLSLQNAPGTVSPIDLN